MVHNCSRLARDLEKTFQTYWVLGAPRAVLPKHWPRNLSSHLNHFQPLRARFDGVPTTAYFSVRGPPRPTGTASSGLLGPGGVGWGQWGPPRWLCPGEGAGQGRQLSEPTGDSGLRGSPNRERGRASSSLGGWGTPALPAVLALSFPWLVQSRGLVAGWGCDPGQEVTWAGGPVGTTPPASPRLSKLRPVFLLDPKSWRVGAGRAPGPETWFRAGLAPQGPLSPTPHPQ